MPLYIDSREARIHPLVRSQLSRELGAVPILCDQVIDFGDYVFTAPPIDSFVPTVAIELASVSDLCGKVNSGRLSFQLSGMIARYSIPILMVESPLYASSDGYVSIPGGVKTVRYGRLMQTLAAAQFHGVRLFFCDRETPPGAAIAWLYKYWQRPYEEHKSFRPATLKQTIQVPLGKEIDDRLSFLMGLPDVGEEKAAAALAQFGSLSTFLSMPARAMQTIPGWGPKTSKGVRDFLDTKVEVTPNHMIKTVTTEDDSVDTAQPTT